VAVNKKAIILNPLRQPYVLQMMAGRQRMTISIDGIELNLFVDVAGDVWAYAEVVTPAIQRFLSRIPLASTDDDESSSAEASADALAQVEQSSCEPKGLRSLAKASEDANSSAGDGEPQAESQDSAGDPESIPDVQGEDESSYGQGRDSENAEQRPGSASFSGDDDGEESVPDGQAEHGDASAAASHASEEATSGALDSIAVQQRCESVQSAGDGAPASENIRRSFISKADLSRTPHSSFGGVFAWVADIQIDRAMIARARRAFRRMLLGGETRPGPRWNARAIAIKSAGYLRQWTADDRRRESGRPTLLILPDVSGSMGKLARSVVAFAVACYGTLSEGTLCVSHSNAEPVEYMPERLSGMSYEQIIRQRNVRAIVIAADHDGEDTFFRLAQLVPRVYWLSPFGCNQMERPRIRDTRKVLADWPEDIQRRVIYADGCGDPESCLTALEMMI